VTDGKTLWHPETIKKESQEQLDKWDKIIGLFSLSELNNNILMWSHYSKNHTGFVVGFDTSLLSLDYDFDYIEPIQYQFEYPIIHPSVDDLTVKFHKKFFYKSNLWSYEHEWRISNNHIDNRIVKLKPDAIKEIIIGCKVYEKEKKEIIKQVKKHLPSDTEIFQATKRDGYFGLDITRIE
jgi:hypothetical protein